MALRNWGYNWLGGLVSFPGGARHFPRRFLGLPEGTVIHSQLKFLKRDLSRDFLGESEHIQGEVG